MHRFKKKIKPQGTCFKGVFTIAPKEWFALCTEYFLRQHCSNIARIQFLLKLHNIDGLPV